MRGGVILSVDFDALQENLSIEACLSSYPKERYQFTWPGKREAKLEARRPINKTLKPCPEKSVNWDTTENIYIEGDNLEALKIMRETYMHKVKMIYIDPPYNTGHDFVYKDNFAQSKEEYLNEDGSYDEEGNRLEENLESNGRFHSDWCSMIYSRLLLARDFLTDDGVIFISIDDSEMDNLKKITDEIFGESNFVNTFIWNCSTAGGIRPKFASKTHEYVLCYAKDIIVAPKFYAPLSDSAVNMYKEVDDNGRYRNKDFVFKNTSTNLRQKYEIRCPDGELVHPKNGYIYRYIEDSFKDALDKNLVTFKRSNTGPLLNEKNQQASWNIYIKKYLGTGQGAAATNIPKEHVSLYNAGTKKVQDLFDGKRVFENVKPVNLIKYILNLYSQHEFLIMDFFSGSATTANAVMELNSEDGGNRKFIMVQLPEECDDKSEAYKAGYHNICEIGEERIRRAGNLIKEEINEANKTPKLGEELKKIPDVGFRVFEVAESNIKDMTLSPGEIHQMNFEELNADNLKEGATNLDLLYEVLPKFRIEYSADVERETLCDKEVFIVNGNQLVACFDTDITNDVIQAIAEIQPLYAVFRDASFANEAARTNLEEIFKAYSPDTQLRVI